MWLMLGGDGAWEKIGQRRHKKGRKENDDDDDTQNDRECTLMIQRLLITGFYRGSASVIV